MVSGSEAVFGGSNNHIESDALALRCAPGKARLMWNVSCSGIAQMEEE